MNSRRRTWFNSNQSRLRALLPERCANCGDVEDLQIHHVVPLALGGSNFLSNMVVLCVRCHGKAHAHDAWEQRRIAQMKGIEKAKKMGLFGGRPINKDLHRQINYAISNGLSVRKTAQKLGCSPTTVQRAKKYGYE